MKQFFESVSGALARTFHSVMTWEWTKQLLYWIIISAGTMSECVFLVASLWMSINSSVHPLILSRMSEDMSRSITELATTAYVALPECILALAFVTTYSHARTYWYNRNPGSLVWTVLYGVPTLVFLVLSLITLACSVTSTSFILPEPLIVTRALAGYMFAFTSLLYTQIGKTQETDRLQKRDENIAALRKQMEDTIINLSAQNDKNLNALNAQKEAVIAELRKNSDAIIANLRNEKEALLAKVSSLSDELQQAKQLLAYTQNEKEALDKSVNQSDEQALAAYSEACLNWLKSDVKSVMISEITAYTGIQKAKVDRAIGKGLLQVTSRNKDKVMVESLISWLKTARPSSGKSEDSPLLHIVNG